MNWLGRFYERFWFATEFWLTPVNRRPLTFIFRDWIFTHVPATIILAILWYLGLGLLAFFGHGLGAMILGCLSSFVLAHLVWGSTWILHQQEYPTYLGED